MRPVLVIADTMEHVSKHRILIVDDDPKLREFLRQELELEGYACQEESCAQDAMVAIRRGGWNLLLLDWSLPDFSGVEICRRIRGTSDSTPVLMITAHDDVKERVEALDAGADDYLTKPFSIEELLARVRAHLRRDSGRVAGSHRHEMLQIADLRLDPSSREVSRSGRSISLSSREFEILQLLMRKQNYVHKRSEILASVWGEDWIGDSNVLDVYVRALRRKIEPSGFPTLIQTVRGVGFMLKEGAVRA